MMPDGTLPLQPERSSEREVRGPGRPSERDGLGPERPSERDGLGPERPSERDGNVEQVVATDMVRRSLPALPVVVLLAWWIWGGNGAISAAFAIGLVVVNFLISAAILVRAARIAVSLLMVAALGGFIVRLALITGAFFLVKDEAWMELVPFGLTLVVTHLGLLVWETRHLSVSLAFPAVRPPPPERG